MPACRQGFGVPTLRFQTVRALFRILRPLVFRWRKLRKLGFDTAIVPRFGADSDDAAYVAFVSGARRVVGYAQGASRRNGGGVDKNDRLFTEILPAGGVKHEVERNLDVVRYFGGEAVCVAVELWTTADDEDFADRILSSWRRKNHGPLVAVACGARAARKIWPAERFGAVCSWLRGDVGAGIVCIGSRLDRKRAQSVMSACGDEGLDLTGRTSLRQLFAVLKRCQMYLGNDTGPMHMAAAARVPVVEVSCHPLTGVAGHELSPLRFGPWGVPSRVVQPGRAKAPCVEFCTQTGPHCILDVPVEEVRNSISSLLSEITAGTGCVGSSSSNSNSLGHR